VACFNAQTGHRRWRVFVCGAETRARGMFPDHTHNLLTLQHQTLYYNTNLGAVAAISARDGRLRWVSLYPRAREGNLQKPAPHWGRDLNPCLFHRGTLLVAPSDSPRIFALDAGTGQILWQTGTEVQDVVHLLGATTEHLIAGGKKLYWIGLKGEERGRVKHVWPDGPEKPGSGRGVLAGNSVLWPAGKKIYLFDQKTARPKKVIDLAARGASGGNLLLADGHLLIATGTELIALSPDGGLPKENRDPVAASTLGAAQEQVHILAPADSPAREGGGTRGPVSRISVATYSRVSGNCEDGNPLVGGVSDGDCTMRGAPSPTESPPTAWNSGYPYPLHKKAATYLCSQKTTSKPSDN
jgi:outer membrane protein assembly factor BamB